MVEMIITSSVTPTNGTPIPFSTVRRNTNGRTQPDAATGITKILTPGIYKMVTNLIVNIGASGNAVLVQQQNGTVIPGSQAEFSAAEAGEIVTMTVQGTVEVVAAAPGQEAQVAVVMQTGSPATTILGGNMILEFME